MDIALYAWHVPYATMLARALPEHHFHALSTPYNPHGWDARQRPLPENVEPWGGPDPELGITLNYWESIRDNTGQRAPDVVLCQTVADINETGRAHYAGPSIFLGHNDARLEAPRLAEYLADLTMPLVCISARKAASFVATGYDRPITLIEPGIDPADFPEWVGDQRAILTVVNNISRPLFDLAEWLEVTRGLPAVLIGGGNEGIEGAGVGMAPSWDVIRFWYQHTRVYLSPTTGPYEDSHNLAQLEAAATGMPIVSLWTPGPDQRHSGEALIRIRERLQRGLDQRHSLGGSVRSAVAARWSVETFAAKWRRVLDETVSGGK